MVAENGWGGVLVDVRRAMTPRGRQQLGRMLVEGERLVWRALRAGFPPRQLLVARSLVEGGGKVLELIEGVRSLDGRVIVAPDEALLGVSEGRNSGLLVGLCELPQTGWRTLPTHPGPMLCLVNVEEPGNIGAMVRTALASGAGAVLLVGGCDPFHPKAIRTSLGSLFTLPLLRLERVEQALEATAGTTRVAAVAQGGRAPWCVPVPGRASLFMGNEGSGLPESVVRLLDEPVTIPMPDGVDSFSVNAAAAVLLYELQRRASAKD